MANGYAAPSGKTLIDVAPRPYLIVINSNGVLLVILHLIGLGHDGLGHSENIVIHAKIVRGESRIKPLETGNADHNVAAENLPLNNFNTAGADVIHPDHRLDTE